MFRIFDTPTHTNSKVCVSDCYSNTLGSAFHRPQLSSPAACSCFFPPPEPVGAPLSLPERGLGHYFPLPLTARARVLIPVVTHQGSAETSCLSRSKGGTPYQTKNECFARAYVCSARSELFCLQSTAHKRTHKRAFTCKQKVQTPNASRRPFSLALLAVYLKYRYQPSTWFRGVHETCGRRFSLLGNFAGYYHFRQTLPVQHKYTRQCINERFYTRRYVSAKGCVHTRRHTSSFL